ncbi:hypothetical protein DNL40_02525 [Xylanimonas oleitrophica]|uniref:Uncharacterized protein n=1 Tax=Xylanimonas oleitrophica TaxID=2607479 RepID=A0A2W5X480_9MICO|nr:hypothetical protein [Xylanimonas oleitrophica]PZR55265.1 hypothetical protein DNL40_02525 [Xylanimonas oleitrophica]
MIGNPHIVAAERTLDGLGSAQSATLIAAKAQVSATLAIAHELRTRNLLELMQWEASVGAVPNTVHDVVRARLAEPAQGGEGA